jgi:hypothetical protein
MGQLPLLLTFVFKTSKARRHILHIGVSIGVPGRRVPGPSVLLSVLDGRVLMAVRQLSVKFADIVVIQFQFQFRFHFSTIGPPGWKVAGVVEKFNVHTNN